MATTPKLDNIAAQKFCHQCGVGFEITDGDRVFLKNVSPVFNGKKYLIPDPEICYECSFQQKLVFKNEKNLYFRKSDYSGKQLITIYSPDKPYKVWELSAWQSDELNAEKYAQEIERGGAVFAQIDKLFHDVPHRHILHFFNPENSDFSNDIDGGKNQYMCFLANSLEDCLYVHDTVKASRCVDCFHSFYSELNYESCGSDYVYNSKYIYNSINVKDSAFIYNSKNLTNCFFCFNLNNKSYCIFNKQYSEEEYAKELVKYDLGSYSLVEKLKKKFFAEWSKYPVKNLNNVREEKSTGDLNESIKDSFNCYNSIGDIEKCKDSANMCSIYNCWRVYAAGFLRNCYEIISAANGENLFFCFEVINCQDSIYSLLCRNSKNIFGCVGLKNKEYCIFNKQYTKEDYEKLVPQIIDQMIENGEWGKFFPMSLSPFGYNESRAHQWYPLTKLQALSMGAKWKNEDAFNFYQGVAPILPDNIKECSIDLVNQVLKCGHCSRNYKIIDQEFQFYQKHSIPIPRQCFHCRYESRLKFKPPAKLWKRSCQKCGDDMLTTYAPDRPEKVYCETCYLKEIY